MYADEMQTQMDYEAQMAEQEMYESQMYADMQQESASYTQADVHDSDWHIADDMEEDAEDEDVVSDGSATAVSDAGNEQAELFMTVFPGVEMTKELAGLFTEVYVTKVTIYDSKNILQVDIRSRHIISRPNIEKAEECIRKFVFGNKRYTVQIREHYTLSTQYNLEAIVKAYQDSILYDIRSFSNVGYRLISRSIGELYCDGDAITIAIEDSKIAHIHAEKIKAYMEEMFQERFDLNVNVAFEYSEADKEKLRRASALVEQQKIDAILNNLRDHGDIIVDGKAVDKDKLGVSKKEDKKSEGHKPDEKKAAPASSGGDSGQKMAVKRRSSEEGEDIQMIQRCS